MRKLKNFIKQNSLGRQFHLWNYARIERSRQKRLQRKAAKHDGNLVVLGIMKNEAMIVEEWIQHYLDQGADKIILIDNGSTDSSLEKAQSYKSSGKVECVSRPAQWRQSQHYWSVIDQFELKNLFEWLLIADLDEFWFCKDGIRLCEALPTQERIDLIYVRMTAFGSSGYIEQPKSIRQSFTKKQPHIGPHVYSKYIVRLSALKKSKNIGIHKVHGIASARVIGDDIRFLMNHYIIMSREYFEKVKLIRGDACNPVKDKIRDWPYFESIDRSCTAKDTQLIEVMTKLEASDKDQRLNV